MGSGASRINSAPHAVVDRRSFENEFSPTEESKLPSGEVDRPDGRNRIMSDPSVKYNPNVKRNEKKSIIARGANLIFSPLLSPPSEEALKVQPRANRKPGQLSRGEHSHRRAEKRYWLDIDANFRKGSWNELQITALVSKPFTGQLRTVAPLKKNRMKNVRTVTVTRTQASQ